MKTWSLAVSAAILFCGLLGGCAGGEPSAPVASDAAPASAQQPAAPAGDASAAAAPAAQAPPDSTGQAADLWIDDAWIRIPPPAAPVAAGYLTVRNPGAAPDRLRSVRTDAADRVEAHEMRMDGEVMRMRELPDGVAVPANGEVRLAPGGTHLMFMQPRAGLAAGDTVEAVLVFERAGERPVTFRVRAEEDGHAEGHADHSGH